MAAFPVSIVTPEHVLLDQQAEAVVTRTVDGDITFLSGHSPFIGVLEPGLVRLQSDDGSEQRAVVRGGFVQVDAAGVRVLAPVAELTGDIDEGEARQQLEAAEAAVAEVAGTVAGDDPATARRLAAAEEDRRWAQVKVDATQS